MGFCTVHIKICWLCIQLCSARFILADSKKNRLCASFFYGSAIGINLFRVKQLITRHIHKKRNVEDQREVIAEYTRRAGGLKNVKKGTIIKRNTFLILTVSKVALYCTLTKTNCVEKCLENEERSIFAR